MAIQIFKNGGSQVVNEYGWEQYLFDGWVLDPAELEEPKKPILNPVLMALNKKELMEIGNDIEHRLQLNMQMRHDDMVKAIMESEESL